MVRRHPILTFVPLAYALSWWPWLLVGPDLPVAGFGPFLAALIVLGLTSGRSGVLGLLKQMVRWRVSPKWYAAALLIPVGLGILGACATVALGAPRPTTEQLAEWPSVLPLFLLMLVIPGFGGAWEEPGWRGFALPRLAAGRPRLVASLLLWPIVVGWHLPLFLTGGAIWADVPAMIGAVLIYNWIYWGSRGSVLLVMIVHAANNSFSGGFLSTLFSDADDARLGMMRAVVWCIAGAIVTLVASRAGGAQTASAPVGNAARSAAGD
jgi:membrane protease YdiL (CAAX protease family)